MPDTEPDAGGRELAGVQHVAERRRRQHVPDGDRTSKHLTEQRASARGAGRQALPWGGGLGRHGAQASRSAPAHSASLGALDLEAQRQRPFPAAILLITLLALGVVGYYSFQTALQYERLGEKSIAEAGLSLANAKVQELEQVIIATDNRVFGMVDLGNLRSLESQWRPRALTETPSVRSLAVLDAEERVLAISTRASRRGAGRFRRLLEHQIVADLELQRQTPSRLRHLHRTYNKRSHLLSYKAVSHEGRRMYLVAHHDVGYLVREVFPTLFASKTGKEMLNVVGEDNQRVFGESLSQVGDYVVGHRFPTTLYQWRLQVAPISAPLLKETGRSSRFNQAALIGLCLGLILGAIAYSLYMAEQQRKLANLKSDFIANVSHELKTPLSVIGMFSEMLVSGRVTSPGQQREYLETIHAESGHLGGLIENVLDFAALERGKKQYEREPHDLFSIASEAVDTFRQRAGQQPVEVTLARTGEGTAMGLVDRRALFVALLNLLDNALKYGGGTAIEVTVKAGEAQTALVVRDRGPGIPPSEIKRVFERFYRSHRSPGVRGSGIGLSLVMQIATAHDGRAWAENAQSGGAQLTLQIPVHKASAREPTSTIDSPQPADIV